ncbi:Fic/DOC family protein [Fusobacterium varium]|jgi:cell filamentation protein|uniref:Fic/DOC family protein n=1 Tax=Fusobacterium varium TaxID=856 RepID=UPI00266DB24C|nr:Fic family protein [Fusobacterium varium]
MKDPYLDENGVLKNKFGIKNKEKLRSKEIRIVTYKLFKIREQNFGKSNNIECLKNINKYLFGDLYEWAGETRKIDMIKYEKYLGGASVEYSSQESIESDIKRVFSKLENVEWNKISDEEKIKKLSSGITELWQAHAFREGNTRTIGVFLDVYTREKNILMDYEVIKKNPDYFRNSLVLATLDETKYIESMIKGCMENGKEK